MTKRYTLCSWDVLPIFQQPANDTVRIGHSAGPLDVSGSTYVNSGTYSDDVEFTRLTSGAMTVDTFSGHDRVSFLDCQLTTLFARLRNGNDVLGFRNTLIAISATLDGGGNYDEAGMVNSDLGSLTHYNFEDGNIK